MEKAKIEISEASREDLFVLFDILGGKEKVIKALMYLKTLIPGNDNGLCELTTHISSKALHTLLYDELLAILMNKAYPSKEYWWPVEDRQSRIEFINESIKYIKNV